MQGFHFHHTLEHGRREVGLEEKSRTLQADLGQDIIANHFRRANILKNPRHYNVLTIFEHYRRPVISAPESLTRTLLRKPATKLGDKELFHIS